jgi:hypothetical protein
VAAKPQKPQSSKDPVDIPLNYDQAIISEVSMKPVWMTALSAALLLTSLPLHAQPVLGAKSGIVNYVQGKVFLADKLLELQPAQFPEINENTVMRTEEGLAEVLLTPGVVLRVGENSSFKMISTRLIDTRLELLVGSAVVDAMEIAKDTNVTLVVKDNSITISKAGIYRFDSEPARLKVFKGSADVKTGTTVVNVSSGKMLNFTGTLAAAEKFNTEETDSLDHWSRRRDELMAMSNVSAANQARKTLALNDPCLVTRNYRTGGVMPLLGSWGYNPYYGLGTYIPCSGAFNSPYGYRYWSPMAVYRQFFAPRPVYTYRDSGSMGMPYPTMGSSSGGYSGAVGSSSSGAISSAPAAAASSGSSAASSSGSSSVGGGAGGGGGRGH